MSFIKFPSHIKPARVGVQLLRVQEINASPLTNIQQVAARGNPAWQWRYEFADLSDSERDIVQGFLLTCKGSVNTFKVTDPGDYEIRGSVSDWIDVYSGYGSFNVVAGSDSISVNSWFGQSDNFHSHITDEQAVRFEWRTHISAPSLGWKGEGVIGRVTSLEVSKAYVQRIKHFQQPNKSAHSFSFRVGSGSSSYVIQSAPITPVFSNDCITAPFYVSADINSYSLKVVDWVTNDGVIGDNWRYGDYRLARCALVSNSENLLPYSNDFAHANWVDAELNVESGWSDASPSGVTSGSWKIYPTATNSLHYIRQTISKTNTQDLYTLAVNARANELGELRLTLDTSLSSHYSRALFWLNSGTYSDVFNQGTFTKGSAEIFDVGSGFYRCVLTCLVNSQTFLEARISVMSGTGPIFLPNGSDGIEIANAQIRKSPFAGQYVPISATTVVGTGWQTGSNIVVDGFDSGDIIKAGTRLEIVNQFHDDANNLFERSEFKRVTEEVVVRREGWATIPIEPPIRNAPVPSYSYIQQDHLGETMHNPVIFHKPEMKGRLLGGTIQYTEKPLKTTDISFDVIEDMTE